MARPKKEGIGSKPLSISADKAMMELISSSGKSPTAFFRELINPSKEGKELLDSEHVSSSIPVDLDFDIASLRDLSPGQINSTDNCIFEGFNRGTVGFITGEGGIGKTKFAINMALQAITKIPFCGIKSHQKAKVTYVTCEDSAQDIFNPIVYFSARYKKHKINIDDEVISNLSLVDFSKTDSDFLNGPMQDYLLENHAESDLFIFDTFSDLHSLDENSSRDMNRLMKALTRFAARTNSSVLILHHTNKASLNLTTQQMRSQSFVRGSSVIVNKAKFFIRLTDIQKGEVEYNANKNSLDYIHATIGGNSIRTSSFIFERFEGGILELKDFSHEDYIKEDLNCQKSDLTGAKEDGLTVAFGINDDESNGHTVGQAGIKVKEQLRKKKREKKSRPRRGIWNTSAKSKG